MVLDVEIGRLLDGLDASVGKGKYVVVLTSDHGVAPVPEVSRARGQEAGRLDIKALIGAIDGELDAALGPANWIAGWKTPGLELDPKLRSKVTAPVFERVRMAAMKQPGVADLLWGPGLPAGTTTSAGQLFRNGYFPMRSDDLIVVTKPWWTYSPADKTGHASVYLYDRAVPLVFFGAGVKKGAAGDAEAIDVAPTFAKLLGIPAPAATRGHALDVVAR
jgi:arylsulfatase A-like enzyme